MRQLTIAALMVACLLALGWDLICRGVLWLAGWLRGWIEPRVGAYFRETTEGDLVEAVELLREPTATPTPEPTTAEVAMKDYVGCHRVGVAVGTAPQQAHWNRPTGAFHLLTADVFSTQEHAGLAELVATWKCEHCLAGLHSDCPGCTCQCAQVEASR